MQLWITWILLVSVPVEEDSIFFGDLYSSSIAQNTLITIFESDSNLLWNNSASSKNSDIIQNSFSVITERWSLDSTDSDTSLYFVNN